MDVSYPIGVTVVMGQQGRVVVPAELRAQLELGPGDELFARVSGHQLILQRPGDMLAGLQAELAATVPRGTSVVEELLAERRAEAAAE